MARFEFRLPDIGEGIAEAEIVAWHVKVGDTVEEDQQLADLMTDKATVEMETPVAGKVVELAGEVGDQIPIGSTLAVIETDGTAADARASNQPETAVRPERSAEREVEGRSEPAQEQRPSTAPPSGAPLRTSEKGAQRARCWPPPPFALARVISASISPR